MDLNNLLYRIGNVSGSLNNNFLLRPYRDDFLKGEDLNIFLICLDTNIADLKRVREELGKHIKEV